MAYPARQSATQQLDAGPQPVSGSATDAARMLAGRRLVVLSGAGLSTDSGIPDYRGPDSPPRAPMTYSTFVSGVRARQRYWARSHLGWSRMRGAAPNGGHRSISALQRRGVIDEVITQNVDGLHSDAGSDPVIDLHGRIDEVICLQCHTLSPRSALHSRLLQLNPGFDDGSDVHINPDGDADLDDTEGFQLADCLRCGGILKPHVVFFGENVPKPRVQRCYDAVSASQGLLVVGSSLSVLSGLRFVRAASREGIPVVICNRGTTRGDSYADLKIDDGCTPVLAELARTL